MAIIMPQGPPAAYQTYAIAQPPDLAVRTACREAGCLAWRHGWNTIVDERTTLGAAQAAYIRRSSRRTFTETATGDGHTVFRFAAGQRCFAEHYTRRQLYVVRGGDWRGNPTGWRRRHTRAADWVEDFGEHQLAVAETQRKG